MAPETKKHRKPAITMTRSDHKQLRRLAESFSEKTPEVAEELIMELERARVVQDGRISPDVVRMGSTLFFRRDLGGARRVTLVFPSDADIADSKVSILTPIGAALIGLSAGQSIDWVARDGRTHRLTVERVEAPTFSSFRESKAELRPAP